MPFGQKLKYIRMRRRDESKHFLTIGDTGVGKSTVIRQLLHYAQECGDTCVVLDSKLEFIPEFFEPRRGDKILSPRDERCIWWDLANEVTDEVDAIAATRAMYPPQPGNANGKWFDDQACKIAAYLWTYSNPRPTCEQFGRWLTDPINEIYPRLKGSEHEHTLDRNAAPQKAGILGTLNQVGLALRMMPRDDERNSRTAFTIREWAQNPQGWLFLPNTAETRDALRPLQSGWVDMCIFRIMSSPQKTRRVWIVLDELDSLGMLSKLHDGMTQLRSTGHPMILGIQNLSQLRDRYGNQSDTIFSQAFTKFILAVSEPKSAKDLQDLMGEVEIRRFRESRTGSFFGIKDRNNFSGPEDIRKPLIMASEVQGLPDLRGYLVQRPADDEVGLHVVEFKLPYEPPIHRHRNQIERRVLPMATSLPNPKPQEAEPGPARLAPWSSTLNPEAARSQGSPDTAGTPLIPPSFPTIMWTAGTSGSPNPPRTKASQTPLTPNNPKVTELYE